MWSAAHVPSSQPRRRRRAGWLVPLALLAIVGSVVGCGKSHLVEPGLESSVAPGRSAAPGVLRATTEGSAVHLQGEIGPGALWSIDTPERWNGDLVVYAHGYSDPVAAIALPNFGPLRDALLARGYAVAASSFSENGYAAKEGVEQVRQLSGLFASRVGRPERTFLIGSSLGGLIGLLLSEKHAARYDGTLLVSGVVGGSEAEVQYLGDIRVLFDVAYPGVLPGGLENPPRITDLNAQVIQPVVAAITAHPEKLPIVFALARRPLPGNTSNEMVNSLVTVLAFCMQGGGDLYDRTHHHSFFDNATHVYASPYLPGPLVDQVNATVARYTASPDAREWLSRYGEADGRLAIPMLTIHNTRDPVVPVWHEDRLADVEAGPWLLQRRFDGYGHVAFSPAQIVAQFEELVGWVSTGQKPAI